MSFSRELTNFGDNFEEASVPSLIFFKGKKFYFLLISGTISGIGMYISEKWFLSQFYLLTKE